MFRDTTTETHGETWAGLTPLGYRAGDENLYRFVDDDPVDETDPSGLIAMPGPGGLNNGEKQPPRRTGGPMTLTGDPEVLPDDTGVYIGGKRIGDLYIKESKYLTASDMGFVRNAVQSELQKITTINHYLQLGWDCVTKFVKKNNPVLGGLLVANKDYYQSHFQAAADRILSSNIKITFAVVYKGSPVNAWAHDLIGSDISPSFVNPLVPGDDVYITKTFIEFMHSDLEVKRQAAGVFVGHELARLFGDQYGKDHSNKPGDVYIWDALVQTITDHKKEIEQCMCSK